MTFSSLADLARQERTRREILQRSDLIPPLPDIVVKVIALLNRNDAEPAEIESHLQYDPVLVARILGMANSPFYGVRRQITSIRDAIMVLGFRGLRSLVLASTTAKFLRRDYRCYHHDDKGLWRHSLCVATGARALARRAKFPLEQCEEVFVAGLLHDIGKMLVAPYLEQLGQTVLPAGGLTDASERSMVGIDHTEAGALAAAKWNLSSTVQELIKHHHETAPVEPPSPALAVLRVADAFAHELQVGYLPGQAPAAQALAADLEALAIGAHREALREAIQAEADAAIDCFARLCT
jgi:putative nucleotidyltransferase with HDIG domain